MQDHGNIGNPVFFRDNRQLSAAEYQKAKQIYEQVFDLIVTREDYIRKNDLDVQFCMPGGFWRIDSGEKNNAKFAQPIANYFTDMPMSEYEIINKLRFYAYPFSGFIAGYNVAALGEGAGPPIDRIPTDQDLASILCDPIGEKGWRWLAGNRFQHLTEEVKKSVLATRDSFIDRWLQATANMPHEYVFMPPKFLGEVGWEVSGVVVNCDTYVYQERLNLLYESGVIDWLMGKVGIKGHVNILEIGGGYGALASIVKSLVPQSNYWVCDLPETLIFSALYLALNRPDCPLGLAKKAPLGFTMMPNYMFSNIQEQFDLVINTLSFTEMSEYQFRTYAKGITKLSPEGILFEQNMNNAPNGGTSSPNILREYFAHEKVLEPVALRDLTQGEARIWSHNSVDL